MRWLLALALACAAAACARVDAQAPAPPGAAWRVVEWPAGTVAGESDAARLQTPVQPGSILKLPALVAALNAGIVTRETRVPCRGEARVGGHVVRCSHPRQPHALGPSEALALSCNVWFATVGSRLPRARFDAVLTALGLPPSPPDAPMPLAATGLRATAAPPLALLEALRRIVTGDSGVRMTDAARRIVMDGLRGAALYGTADAFADRGVDAAVKTGTADAPGGGVHGLVVAAWPASAPTHGLVLIAAGNAGSNAAELAAEIAAGRRRDVTSPGRRVGPAAPQRETGSAAVKRSTTLRVGTAQGRTYAVREYDLEDYVARVVAGEAAPRSAPAALEALAIAVRSFALANRGRHARDGFDLCTLTHCQVLREPHEAARRAARATEGQVLVDRGAPAPVYFSASCGGRTEKPSAVWPGADDPSWLPSRRDRACGGEPRWAAEISIRDLERALRAAGISRGRLRRLSIDGRSSSGRVLRLRLEGLVPDRITGQDFRIAVGRTLGWQLVKSTAFDLKRTGAGYRFEGRGFGHGVGMCVIGSARRAERGESAQEILDAYYPGLKIVRFAPTDDMPAVTRLTPAPRPQDTARLEPAEPAPPPTPAVASTPYLRIQLPPSAEFERAALTDFARRSLDALSRATGRPVPGQVELVFHPTAASFQRETGEPWWSAARTRGTRVDLLPPSVLRARGTLESTLRHELAHVLTAPVLEDRPVWVREGVAMYFAGEPPPASLLDEQGRPRRVRCPSDDDLRRPPSPAAAREAYARAAACVAREIHDRTAWTDIR